MKNVVSWDRATEKRLRRKLSKGNDADLKRAIAAGLVLVMLVCMITVSASPAGSSEDPLISQSYLSGAFSASMRSEITKKLGETADTAIGKLDEIYRDKVGYAFAPRFMPLSLSSDGSVALTTGSSFILLSGSASITVSRGTIINISTGNEVESGSQMTQNQRYFCAEDTRARIITTSAASGLVDGSYFTEGTVVAPRPLPFTDIPTSAWFYPAVEFVFRNELFSGTAPTTFSPNSSMTRGMFVTVLHRLDGRPKVGAGGDFTDVGNQAAFYYDAVTWASDNGIVKGYTDGTFQPDRSVTREEMAVIMHRYAAYKDRDMSAPDDALNTFPDRGEVSTFAVDAVRWAVSLEIIRGSGGRLLPGNTATRAEVAQIIFNYCDKVGR